MPDPPPDPGDPRRYGPRLRLLGGLAVFGSGLCFYLATVIISWSHRYVEISAPYYAFARFLLGFLLVCLTLLFRRQRPVCKQAHYLAGRALTNTGAVFFFYKAVDVSTVAAANILNMSYPLFVAIFAWFTLRGQRDVFALAVVGIASVGTWMVLEPGSSTNFWHSGWGLLSGLTAAGSMIYLTLCRKEHESQTILFYTFGIGALVMLPFFYKDIFLPDGLELFFLVLCSAAGVLGQYLLTRGFLYVTAVEGSIISSSRILIAALFGPLLVCDPPLTLMGWTGAVLLFSANVALALRASNQSSIALNFHRENLNRANI